MAEKVESKLQKDFGVRALLATIVVTGAVAGSLFLIYTGDAKLGMGFLSSAGMGAIGFYFGEKTGRTSTTPTTTPTP